MYVKTTTICGINQVWIQKMELCQTSLTSLIFEFKGCKKESCRVDLGYRRPSVTATKSRHDPTPSSGKQLGSHSLSTRYDPTTTDWSGLTTNLKRSKPSPDLHWPFSPSRWQRAKKIEWPEKTTRGGWMRDNQNFSIELGIYPKINLMSLSSNSTKTEQL
jgi:hypothetical protein